MQKEYNVLWIEDDAKLWKLVKREAKNEGIILDCYKSKNSGLDALIKNPNFYDGIILDGIFLENENDVEKSAKPKYFEFQKEIPQTAKNIACFIYTGQADLEKNDLFNYQNPIYYSKNIDDDLPKLFTEIKRKADDQVNTKIRHKYSRVFEVCINEYLGEEIATDILSILKKVENSDDSTETKDYFNPIRKVLETLFAVCNAKGFLPDEIYKDKGWMNNSSKFLIGSHTIFKSNVDIMSPMLQFSLKNLMKITQDACHKEGSLSLKVDEHVRAIQSPYLFQSSVFQLLDVMLWFKIYIDSKPVTHDWTKKSVSNLAKGIIEKDKDGNYHCGEYLLNPAFTANNFDIGEEIVIQDSSDNGTYKSRHLYPLYAIKFKKT
jgi:hypothetical protein